MKYRCMAQDVAGDHRQGMVPESVVVVVRVVGNVVHVAIRLTETR